MAGFAVNRGNLDMKTAQTIVDVREAFRNVRTVQAAHSNLPDVDGVDPLTTGEFDYTPDEAYLIRLVFGDLNALAVQPILDTGRKLTGLE
jgi:hypothetical protein